MTRRVNFVLTLLFFAGISTAQDYRIEYSDARLPGGKEYLQEIKFFGEGNLIKKVDVFTFNPFAALSYPRKAVLEQQFPVYDLTGRKLSDIISAEAIKAYAPGRRNASVAVDRGRTELYTYRENPAYSLLSYLFRIENASSVVGLISSLYVYDLRGKELLSFPAYDVNIRDAAISPKGRFLCHYYGIADSSAVLLPEGLRIFDVVYRKYFDIPVKSAELMKLTERYLILTQEGLAGSEVSGMKLLYFDFRKNLLYTQVYDNELAAKISMEYGEFPRFVIDGMERIPEKDFGMQTIDWIDLKSWK